MVGKLLSCGLLAGLCAGLLAAGFVSLVGEPPLDAAIAHEERREGQGHAGAGHGHAEQREAEDGHGHPAPVSRELQKSAGLLTASVVYGLALGGVFALVFALAYGRVARAAPRVTAYALAAAAFVVVYLVPFVKYPATPPGASDPSTIGHRTALYMAMIAISVLAAVAAARLRPALAARLGAHGGTVAALAAFVVVATGGGLALPAVDEVPAGFPATTLWEFREASLGMHAVLWTTLGLVFAPVAQRVLDGRSILPRRRRASARPALAGD